MSQHSDHQDHNTTDRANQLLDSFAKFPPHYLHGTEDSHFRWLQSVKNLPVESAVRFFNVWRPLSRHQPQLLLLLASVFSDPLIQKKIIKGNAEEEGGWNDGHDPHWVLLDQLIQRLGGTPIVVARSEEIMVKFENSLRCPMSEATASGILAGIENPALDISAYFREIVLRSGFANLLKRDLYLTIHVKVEPHHIVDSHEMALWYMKQGSKERDEVLGAFQQVMKFWSAFWEVAFSELGELPVAA